VFAGIAAAASIGSAALLVLKGALLLLLQTSALTGALLGTLPGVLTSSTSWGRRQLGGSGCVLGVQCGLASTDAERLGTAVLRVGTTLVCRFGGK
jgi:hypothetical protein